jgi:hypothetical protein
LRNGPALGLQSPKQKYRPLVIVLAAMIVAGLSLEDTEKKFREKVVPEPETERQETAAALGDPKSSLRYLNL